MAHKPLWDWMDKHEGRKEGDSTKALEKEKNRQGIDDSTARKIQNFGEQHPDFHSKGMKEYRSKDKKKYIAKKMKK